MFSKVRLIKWNIRFVILIGLVILLLVPSLTFAYNLWGKTWLDVDPLYYYFDSWPGYKTKSAFTAAKSDWNAASTPVNFQWSASYDIYCYEWYDSGTGMSGFTSHDTYEIYIFGASCGLNMYWTDDYDLNWRKSVAGHELGHALGLLHVSGAKLMNGYDTTRCETYGVFTPQADDINGVNAMYG